MSDSTAPVTEAAPRPFVWRRFLVLLVRALALFVLILTVASFAARFHWRCEQVCHFRLQYGWLLLIASAVLLLVKDRRFASVSVCGAVLNFVFVVPIYWPANQPHGAGKTWRLVSYNVRSRNEHYAEVLAMLRQEQADVVLVCEVNAAWARELESLSDLYPHQHIVPAGNNFGIALLSRGPWKSIRSELLGPAQVVSIVAEFDQLGPRPFTFIGTHPPPPYNHVAAPMRNAQLAEIAATIPNAKQPTIVAGDLNTTSYSPFFHDLLRDANLRDSRQGIGVQASLSPRIPLLFSIPIDHVLVSPEFEVVSRRVGGKLGSDHRPVIVELR